MLWIKAFHIIAVVTWFAGLFYLPRLFVYHALSEDQLSKSRFQIMERKLFWGIMTPSALVALSLGIWLWLGFGFRGGWLHAKLAFVIVLVLYHLYCWRILNHFISGVGVRSHIWYRWFNEIPVLILLACVILVVVKPF